MMNSMTSEENKQIEEYIKGIQEAIVSGREGVISAYTSMMWKVLGIDYEQAGITISLLQRCHQDNNTQLPYKED